MAAWDVEAGVAFLDVDFLESRQGNAEPKRARGSSTHVLAAWRNPYLSVILVAELYADPCAETHGLRVDISEDVVNCTARYSNELALRVLAVRVQSP